MRVLMDSLKYTFKDNIPVINCSFCGKCQDFIETKDYININRGCCWHFPKYNLMDLKNIMKINEKFVRQLFTLKDAEISQYSIKILGKYYENEYIEYASNKIASIETSNTFDDKLHFKVCHFFGENGCKIDFCLRSHQCNLYLCREIVNAIGIHSSLYKKERQDYFSYCYYYDKHIEYALKENQVDFVKDYSKALEIIKSIDIPEFDPQYLQEIQFF